MGGFLASVLAYAALTSMSKEFYQDVRTPYWDRHGVYNCQVKGSETWNIAPTPWSEIHKLLGFAGINTPDATGGSLQFVEEIDDDIAGSSAANVTTKQGTTDEPIPPGAASSSSTCQAEKKKKAPTYAEIIRSQPEPIPNYPGKNKAKDRGVEAAERESLTSRQAADEYTIDESPPPSIT